MREVCVRVRSCACEVVCVCVCGPRGHSWSLLSHDERTSTTIKSTTRETKTRHRYLQHDLKKKKKKKQRMISIYGHHFSINNETKKARAK